MFRPLLHATLLAALLPLSTGCRSAPSAATQSSSTPLASASAAPEYHSLSPELVQKAVNPDGEKPYAGPIGGIRGVVHVSGPPAPDLPAVLSKIPNGRCDDARAFYGKLFREGPARELGDVLVAVTGYKGYIPAPSDVKKVVARGCAFESRTIALVFGQRIEVENKGGETFIPKLIGAKQAALQVAVPGGDTVKLFPQKVGGYQLQDQTHDYATADVLVLKFPTFAVTGLDGRFEIKDIPAGSVTLSAYLPATHATVSQSVNVVAGETTNLELTIAYVPPEAAPAPSGSGAH